MTSPVTDHNIKNYFDQHNWDMSLTQYQKIVEYAGKLINPDDHRWISLDNYQALTPEARLADYWIDVWGASQISREWFDDNIFPHIRRYDMGSCLSQEGIFIEDGSRLGYFEI